MRELEDEKRLRHEAQIRDKQKKNQFYDQLSKKTSKKVRQFFNQERKGGIFINDQQLLLNPNIPVTGK